MKWEYDKSGYWIASRSFHNSEVCDFIYIIYGNEKDGYTAEACNNAYGAERVAVENEWCEKESVFYSLNELKERIENGTQLWLYTGYCNCVGEITAKEY